MEFDMKPDLASPITTGLYRANMRGFEQSRQRWYRILPVAMLLPLAACAGGRVDHVALAPIHAPAPAAFRIDVSLAPDLRAVPAAGRVAETLQAGLIKRYGKAGFSATAAMDGAAGPGIATVHVRISRADPGNPIKRLVIGFGAGRSSLRTDTSLDLPGDSGAALTFSSATDSGRKPGMILPGGIAAATGNLVHLAIGGGLDLALIGRSSLARNADRSAKLIVDQTHNLYRTAGWRWPTA
jgi:hypothetical protein